MDTCSKLSVTDADDGRGGSQGSRGIGQVCVGQAEEVMLFLKISICEAELQCVRLIPKRFNASFIHYK